ncbi:MAG: glycogen synthase [Sphaerochaetaceae bacterium]|nr:glycogen synthase [Sphaerochaetaceae bacterium]
MKVLMVSSETVPFSKSGGLADVVGALSPALAMSGVETRVLMPLYGFISEKDFKYKYTLSVPMLDKDEKVDIVSTKLKGVEYVALKHPVFTERKGIYGDTSFAPYGDNSYRYLLMSKAVLAYMKRSRFDADIVHCHDWTSGLVPFLLKKEGFLSYSIFTIHNLAYQGTFPRFDALQLGYETEDGMFSGSGIDRRLNMLKAGLVYSDMITTVSESYVDEIQEKEQGCGLEELLKSKKDSLAGILNGIDTEEWNPETDKFFKTHFSSSDLSGKKKLKAKVQKKFGLSVDPDTPLIAMISRIAEQKGFHELLHGTPCALEKILDKKCQVLLIGTGDKEYVDKLNKLAEKYDNLSVNIIFSQEASHLVEGAADFFLMPSRYEPCGLNQMYSLRYGTLPIVHETGGLKDTVIDIDSDLYKGNGFSFKKLDSDEIVKCVSRALAFYEKGSKQVDAARKIGMNTDFSWKESAQKYIKIYEKLLGGTNE